MVQSYNRFDSICYLYDAFHPKQCLKDRKAKHNSKPESRRKRDLPGLLESMNNCYYASKILHEQWEECPNSYVFDVSDIKPLDHGFTNMDELKQDLKAKFETNTEDKLMPWYKGGKAKFNMKVKQMKAKTTSQQVAKACKDKDE